MQRDECLRKEIKWLPDPEHHFMKVLVSEIRLVQVLQNSIALIMRHGNSGPLVTVTVRRGNNLPSFLAFSCCLIIHSNACKLSSSLYYCLAHRLKKPASVWSDLGLYTWHMYHLSESHMRTKGFPFYLH